MTRRIGPATAFGLALLPLASPVRAEWKQVSRPSDKQLVSIDMSSLSRSGDVATAWSRISPPAIQSAADYGPDGLPIARATAFENPVYLIQMACGAKLVRVSTQGTATAQINPFAPDDMSPYTFQPLRNGAAFALYYGMCPQAQTATSTYTKPDATRILPPTPARTMARNRNPWKDKLTR